MTSMDVGNPSNPSIYYSVMSGWPVIRQFLSAYLQWIGFCLEAISQAQMAGLRAHMHRHSTVVSRN